MRFNQVPAQRARVALHASLSVLLLLAASKVHAQDLTPPSNAKSITHIELDGTYMGSYYPCGGATGPDLRLWQTQPDCNTGGNKSGTTSIVPPPTPPPSGDKQVREYSMTYDGTAGAGVRWFDVLANSSTGNIDGYTNFQYDVWVFFDQIDIKAVYNLEMDLNQVVAGTTGQCGSSGECLYIFATQCDMNEGKWQLGNGWPLTADQACTRSMFPAGWHHVQIQFYRGVNPGDEITFAGFAIDGPAQIFSCGGLACKVATIQNTNWGKNVLGPNFQLDGEGGYTSLTGYADSFTIYMWE
jgi:hypothetical protein